MQERKCILHLSLICVKPYDGPYHFFFKFLVRCKAGFKVLGTQCIDVDECRDECASRSQASLQSFLS